MKLKNLSFACAALAFLITAGKGAASGQPDEPKTHITGGTMDIIKGGQQIVFSNGAKVTKGENELNASKIIQDKQSNTIEAFNNIDFKTYTTDKELILGYGEKARYDLDMNKGELTEGRPHLLYFLKNSTAPVSITADLIRFDKRSEMILARGGVDIISSSGTAHSPSADFEQQHKQLILSGVPQSSVVYLKPEKSERSDFFADNITLNFDKHMIYFSGNVKGKIITARTPGK